MFKRSLRLILFLAAAVFVFIDGSKPTQPKQNNIEDFYRVYLTGKV
jgi:hypothetical protein